MPIDVPLAFTTMHTATFAFFAQTTTLPSYFTPIFFTLLIAGAVAALVATITGFRRAPAFGKSARWFALSALCLLLYHVQFFVLAGVVVGGLSESNAPTAIGVVAFFNLFIALAAVCAIMGFVRLTDTR
jgi:hypothetical protein